MHATPNNVAISTVAIDLAKDVFELAFADADARIVERRRLNRTAFACVLDNRPPLRVVMEAYGSAHYWARRFARLGDAVVLLPAHDVRPYVRRNKTDRTDAVGLLEAARCASIRRVPVKTPEQPGIQGLHRVREFHKAQRTAAINLVRGLLREFGIILPPGAAKVRPAVLAALEDADNELPMSLRDALRSLLDAIATAEQDMLAIEVHLQAFLERDTRSQRLQRPGGIGLITATALSAPVGDIDRFPSGRLLASSLGLTPREHSSGSTRQLGRVTKRGDVYLRMLLFTAHAPCCAVRRSLRRRSNRSTNPHLGARAIRTDRPQQGRCRPRQQAGTAAVGRRASPPILRSRPRQRARRADDPLSSHPALHRAKRRWQTSRSPGRESR